MIDTEVELFLSEKHPGSKLLSKNITPSSKIEIICENGHKRLMLWQKIKRGQWCGECFKNKKTKTINEIDSFVKEKHNGKCLSENYKNNTTKLKFQCNKDHVWEASWANIMSGHWCPFCNTPVPTIETIQEFVKEKGKCLSKEYITAKQKLKFQCNCGNIFERTWNEVQSKKIWCPAFGCSGSFRPTIDFIKNFVEKKYNGKCLSEKYINYYSPMLFECKNGHKIKMKWSNVFRGHWCSDCYGNSRLSIEKINEKLKEKYNGKCLSKTYKNNKSLLIFECAKGHQWKSCWHNVSYCWCPVCSAGFGEKITRFVFEKMFNSNFEKIKPDWLKYYTGNNLELDGYSEELKIAFEYQGRQHFELHEKFHSCKEDLKKQQARDRFKRKKCKELGITLICIPEFSKKFKYYDLKGFVAKKIKNKYAINNHWDFVEFWKHVN